MRRDYVEPIGKAEGGPRGKTILLTGQLEEAIDHFIAFRIPFQKRPKHFKLGSMSPPWKGARFQSCEVHPLRSLLSFEYVFTDPTEGIWGKEVPLLPLTCCEDVRRNILAHVLFDPETETVPRVSRESINSNSCHMPQAEEDEEGLAEGRDEAMREHREGLLLFSEKHNLSCHILIWSSIEERRSKRRGRGGFGREDSLKIEFLYFVPHLFQEKWASAEIPDGPGADNGDSRERGSDGAEEGHLQFLIFRAELLRHLLRGAVPERGAEARLRDDEGGTAAEALVAERREGEWLQGIVLRHCTRDFGCRDRERAAEPLDVPLARVHCFLRGITRKRNPTAEETFYRNDAAAAEGIPNDVSGERQGCPLLALEEPSSKVQHDLCELRGQDACTQIPGRFADVTFGIACRIVGGNGFPKPEAFLIGNEDELDTMMSIKDAAIAQECGVRRLSLIADVPTRASGAAKHLFAFSIERTNTARGETNASEAKGHFSLHGSTGLAECLWNHVE